MTGNQHTCPGLWQPGQQSEPGVHRSLPWFWCFAPNLWDKSGRYFSTLGSSTSPASCQALEPFIHHSWWGINSLGLIYGDRQEPLPAELMLLPLSWFLAPPCPWRAPTDIKLILDLRSYCALLTPMIMWVFSFLIFKEAYLQGEEKFHKEEVEVAERTNLHILRALLHILNDSKDTSCQITTSVKYANPHHHWQQNDFTSKKCEMWEKGVINLVLLQSFHCMELRQMHMYSSKYVAVCSCWRERSRLCIHPSYSSSWN